MARMCLALALFVLQCGIANAVPLAFAPGLENDAAEGVRTDFGFDYMHLVQVCCDAHNISWWLVFQGVPDQMLLDSSSQVMCVVRCFSGVAWLVLRRKARLRLAKVRHSAIPFAARSRHNVSSLLPRAFLESSILHVM